MNKQAQKSVATAEPGVATHKFLIHNKEDHVGVATREIEAGEKVIGVYMDDDSTVEIIAKSDIPLGHKIALVQLGVNKPVLKYGVQIGLTTTEWAIGDYVHTHNIKTARW